MSLFTIQFQITMAGPVPKRRCCSASPDRFVVGLLLVVCLLWLSQASQWFGLNHHKGWAVLFAVAAAGTALVLMLLWWAAGLLFHWRFQFGIRTLLALMLVCSIAFAWLAAEVKQAGRQAETVRWIKSSDRRAALFYYWECDANGNIGISKQQPPEPEWLRKALGDDFFSTVAIVVFGSRITDAGLDRVSGLNQLKWLNLNSGKITDAGLRNLRDLPRLEGLQLMGANITDAGMEDLKCSAHLRDLYLNCTRITDAGVERLGGFTQLRRLDLDGNRITDEGVRYLDGMN